MRLGRALPAAACCLILLRCGRVRRWIVERQAPDSSKIPTATLPAPLPAARIISSGALQPGGGASYTVKEGDTMAGIAARFGVSLQDLRDANPSLDPGRLPIGQTVRLPASNDAPAAASTAAPAPTKPPEATATEAPPTEAPPTVALPTSTPSSLGQTYVVQDGDIPVRIAEKFGITVEELLAANPGIDPTNLHIGDVLIIPPKREG
jgi:LysM repeat protein